MRTTVDLDADLLAAIRERAASRRTTLSRVVEDADAVPLRPGPSNWTLFASLCASSGASGKVIADAYHAALAIEHGCEWVTADADFSRFEGLRWRHPFQAGA